MRDHAHDKAREQEEKQAFILAAMSTAPALPPNQADEFCRETMTRGKPERRPVQIAARKGTLFALATDGTIWEWTCNPAQGGRWNALPALPQPEKETP